jgi:prophage regulatory protein
MLEINLDRVSSPKLLRLPDLLKKLGVSRSTVYSWLKEGSTFYRSDFPRPCHLGMARAIFWRESEIDDWIESELAKSTKTKTVANQKVPNPNVVIWKTSNGMGAV